jgi:hypothetical protein
MANGTDPRKPQDNVARSKQRGNAAAARRAPTPDPRKPQNNVARSKQRGNAARGRTTGPVAAVASVPTANTSKPVNSGFPSFVPTGGGLGAAGGYAMAGSTSSSLGGPLTDSDIAAIRARYIKGPNAGLRSAYDAANRNMDSELNAAVGGIGMAFDRGRGLIDERVASNALATTNMRDQVTKLYGDAAANIGALASDFTGDTGGGAAMGLVPVTGAVNDTAANVSANGSIEANLTQQLGNITGEDLHFLAGLLGVEQGAQVGAAQRLQASNKANLSAQYAKMAAEEEARQEQMAAQAVESELARRRDLADKIAIMEYEKSGSTPQVNPVTASSELAWQVDKYAKKPINELMAMLAGTGAEDMANWNPQAVLNILTDFATYAPPTAAEGQQVAREAWATLLQGETARANLHFLNTIGITNANDLYRKAYGV